MNKNKKIVWMFIVALILVALGIRVYIIYSNRTVAPIVNADGTIKGNYSVESIRLTGKNYQCVFTKSDDASKITGTLQITQNELRGDFDLTLNDKNFASHLIETGDTAYTWTSLEPIGLKSPIIKSITQNSSPADQAELVGTQDKMDFTCSPWNVDTKVFEIPTGITFSVLKN